MPVYLPGAPLLSGTGLGSGSVNGIFDNRVANSVGYLYVSAAGASAIVTIVASHNRSAWLPVLTVTAVTGGLGQSAQISAFYPYLAAQINTLHSGAAGTANPLIYWTPGLV